MKPFWETKPLAEMSHGEWESLCDGCGRCCVYKYEDRESRKVDYSGIACRYLDLETCRCTAYEDRLRLRPDCVHLSPDDSGSFEWLPSTCAYRLLHGGAKLPSWHPLVTGDPDSTQRHGMSVRNRAVSEEELAPGR